MFGTYHFSAYSWILFGTTTVALFLASAFWRRRRAPGALILAIIELAVAAWAFPIAFEAAAQTIPLKRLWSQLAYPGTMACPLFFFLFAMSYGQQRRYLTRRNMFLLAIIPCITVLLAVTNSLHGWVWKDILLDPAHRFAVYVHGAWFWIAVVYSYLLMATGLIVMAYAVWRFPAFYRRQTGALICGALLPFTGNIVYVFDLNPIPNLDWTPVMFLLSGFILAFATFRYRMFDLIPTARNRILDTMSDGVLVLDAEYSIVDLNPAMVRIIGRSDNRIVGSRIQDVVPALENPERRHTDTSQEPEEISIVHDTQTLCFDIRRFPLFDDLGQSTGGLIVFRDITQRKALEAERDALISELRTALTQIKTLRGLLPICAKCKKIRDDTGYWHNVEVYVKSHTQADFSHSICPDCAAELYPTFRKKT